MRLLEGDAEFDPDVGHGCRESSAIDGLKLCSGTNRRRKIIDLYRLGILERKGNASLFPYHMGPGFLWHAHIISTRMQHKYIFGI